jgi:hypothetical protein
LRDFSLKEKLEDRGKFLFIIIYSFITVIYQATYVSTPESMSGIESIKVDALYQGNP